VLALSRMRYTPGSSGTERKKSVPNRSTNGRGSANNNNWAMLPIIQQNLVVLSPDLTSSFEIRAAAQGTSTVAPGLNLSTALWFRYRVKRLRAPGTILTIAP
jgi:hypothetical protein